MIVLKFWFHWSFDCIEVLIPLKFRLHWSFDYFEFLFSLKFWFNWSFDFIGVSITSEFQLHRSFDCIEVLISSMFWLHWFFDFVAVLIALETWLLEIVVSIVLKFWFHRSFELAMHVKPKANTLMTTFRCCLYLIGHRPLIFQ